MKIFAGLILAIKAEEKILGELVKKFCGFDLHDFYETTGLAIEYRVKPRKIWTGEKSGKSEWKWTEIHDPWNGTSKKITGRYAKSKAKGPSHWRDVVRVNCVTKATSRGGTDHENFMPLGGYPTKKRAPMIKCTKKGLNGTPKLKPNSRRWRGNKILDWFQRNCA